MEITQNDTAEAALIAGLESQPVTLRRMSDAARAPEWFNLGLATRLAREKKISRKWDGKRNHFVFSAIGA